MGESGRNQAAAAAVVPPSGAQVEIRRGDAVAVVTEVGATLRMLLRSGVAVIDGFGEAEMCTGARGQPLLPWPNRIRDGRYSTGRHSDLQLALTEPARGNAIHGLTRWENWVVRDRRGDACVLGLVLHAQPGYPFCLDLSVAYSLDSDGLLVTTAARNVGGEATPYGAGYHPYFALGVERIDDLQLRLPASHALEADERRIPTGRLLDVSGDSDFRSLRRVGAAAVDAAYTGLERDAGGIAHIDVSNPAGGAGVDVWMDDAHSHVMLFTGDTLEEGRRRTGLAVEPMTCAPNAFATGDARLLQPGETWTTRWGIRWLGRWTG